jgi:hypothetical protein
MSKLHLQDLTLVAAASVNVVATLRAIEASQALMHFGACKLFTHTIPEGPVRDVDVILIPELRSSMEYSQFMLRGLSEYITTSHCLVVQWDGYVLDPDRWDPNFLDYDYIGASWPQFSDGHDVGNGGFSLRSKRLLEACRSEDFKDSHPEDVAIGRHNRPWLETQGLRFAPRELANSFSTERASAPEATFGFHGVWRMPQLIGADRFWDLYRKLEDRTSVYRDQSLIMRQLAGQPNGLRRCFKMGLDRLWQAPRHRIGQT